MFRKAAWTLSDFQRLFTSDLKAFRKLSGSCLEVAQFQKSCLEGVQTMRSCLEAVQKLSRNCLDFLRRCPEAVKTLDRAFSISSIWTTSQNRDNFETASGQLRGSFRTASRHLPDSFTKDMDNFWSAFGQLHSCLNFDNFSKIKTACRQLPDSFQTASGQLLDSLLKLPKRKC